MAIVMWIQSINCSKSYLEENKKITGGSIKRKLEESNMG